jgi:hypothetical protein
VKKTIANGVFVFVAVCLAVGQARPAAQQDDRLKAPFSLVSSLSTTTAQAGGDLIIEVTITNTADYDLFYVVPDEIEMPFGLEVRDSEGHHVPYTPQGRRTFGGLFDGSRFMLKLHPGESLYRERLLNKDFEISKPGTYTVWATRQFGRRTADSKIVATTVKSNIETITIAP